MQNVFNVLVAQSDWAILVVRLALGVIFIAHGWRKLKNYSGTVAWMRGEGFYPGWLWAPVVTAAEIGGGLLILIGLFTQPAAMILAINMVVAFIYNFRKNKGFFSYLELDLILLATLLLLATLGSGFYALSSVI